MIQTKIILFVVALLLLFWILVQPAGIEVAPIETTSTETTLNEPDTSYGSVQNPETVPIGDSYMVF